MSIFRIEILGLILAAAMLAVSIAWLQPETSLSLLCGAVVSVGSFMLLHLFISQAIKKRGLARIGLIAAAALKLAVIGFLLWLVVTRFNAKPLPLFIGLSTVVLAILIESQYAYWTKKDAA